MMSTMEDNYLELTINDNVYKVGPEIPAETTLNTYLRDYANLPGTKFMCREGGCGACIVTMETTDPITHKSSYLAINSCLMPLRSCQNTKITTIEGVGNRKKGYHKTQLYLAKFNGTQCGFCSPGMVMNMYSLLLNNPNIKMKEVENSFGGNICRCTGYRPIMDAFKALASDADPKLQAKLTDIEDVSVCQSNGNCENCNGNCAGMKFKQRLASGKLWLAPTSVGEVLEILKNHESYMLVGGNTALGVEKCEIDSNIFIDTKQIDELHGYKLTESKLEVGANMTLTDAMDLFIAISSKKNFSFLKILADHIDLIANVPVRNTGTLAGNLMIKHRNHDFPSDIFLILETVGAQLIIEKFDAPEAHVSMKNFLETDMNKKLIKRIVFNALSEEYHVKTFKIMPRAQNVHAYINAGFKFKLDKNHNVMDTPSIVFGGINPKFVHAERTERYFEGKNLLKNEVIQEGLKILSEEIKPKEDALKPTSEYRKKAAVLLLYKFFLKFALGVDLKKVDPRNAKGGENLKRELGRGEQDNGTKASDWPANKTGPKIEGLIQSSGEAEYVNDLPPYPGQLHGAFVLAKEALGDIDRIDPTKALNINGVIAFYTAKDIPGCNNMTLKDNIFTVAEEPIFSDGKVFYAGQPVGIIIADDYEVALKAAKKVQITYKNKQKALLNVKQVLERNEKGRIVPTEAMWTQDGVYTNKSENVIQGDLELGAQYHFTMETQSCVCVPIEDGLNVFSSTQWMQNVQGTIADCLNLPVNSINLQVRRLGGGFGSKITKSALVATACALAAYKLNRPVRMILNIETNMEAVGKRRPAYSQYKVGFDKNGKIEEAEVKLYSDNGCTPNDPYKFLIRDGIKNCYQSSNWDIQIFEVKTDVPGCSWMRGPGTIEGMVTVEQIMDHIATVLDKNPLEIRLINFGDLPQLRTIIDTVRKTSEYDKRLFEIEKFNKENRWNKKGISLIPMKFYLDFFFDNHATMSVYAEDGTVSVCVGGIEMGQGLNTKVAQVCAYNLGIPLEMVKIKPTNSFTAPNNGLSGASTTSDTCSYSALKCCEIMTKRLAPIKEKLGNPTWKELIAKAYSKGIDLNVSYKNTQAQQELKGSDVFAAAVTEVEVDILTGKYIILRTDILEDAGESLSPFIDIGQMEGAFVMGLGYMLTERLVFDEETGRNLTNRTWHYWPPGVKDIPADFRVNIARDMPNPSFVLRSKSTGEPPICLAYSAVSAIRDALKSARGETGLNKEWFNLDQPCSVDKILMAACTSLDNLKIS